MRTTWLTSARARFIATAATVFALVALGGVTAAPASADVNIYIIVQDGDTGAALANQSLQFGPTGNAYGVTTDVSGGFGWGGPGWSDGSYSLINPNPGLYVNPAPLILDGSITHATISLVRFAVTGSIPAAAGSGLTSVTIEQNSGGWSAVGTATVTSATGAFSITMPNGAAEYRLRFTPSSSTDYLETVSAPFTFSASVGVIGLGALSLVQAPVIRGTVLTQSGGAPLAGATVYASLAGADVASATTDGSGAYRIALPVGDAAYTVRAEAVGFASQTWNVNTVGADTVAVNATAGYWRSGVDFSLVGLPVTISGTIFYYHLLSEMPQVSLYSAGPTPTLVAQATIVPSGIATPYSFPAVPAGDYFVKVVPAEVDPFFDTLLGDSGYTEWSRDASADTAFSASHGFSVSATVPSSAAGHDLYLTDVDATFLSGNFLAPGSDAPVQGCVQVTDVNDPAMTVCAPTNSQGAYSARVPTGQSYTLHAIPSSNRYSSQWWWNTQDAAQALAVGPTTRGVYGSYSFYIGLAPATINVDAADVAATDPITVYVYYRSLGSSNWSPLTSAVTDPVNGSTALSFLQDFYSGAQTGLTDGEYRLRFQDVNGTWLAATTYESGIEPTGSTTAGPACFVDVTPVADGAPHFVHATFDSAAQTTSCAAQQYEYGAVDGTVVASPSFLSVPVAGHVVTVVDEDSGTSRSNTTGTDGSFSFTSVPNATYTVQVEPTSHVAGSHEYGYLATGLALGNGDIDLGPLVATRYGNVTGTITNWAAAGTTGTVTVYTKEACGCWTPGPLSVAIAADGSFEVPGVDVDGEYGVRVDFDSDYAPVFLGGGFPEPTDPFTGTAEQDYALPAYDVDLIEYVSLSGRVTFEGRPVDDGLILVIPDGDDGTNAFPASTDNDGYYEAQVVPTTDYRVIVLALYSDVKLQGYGGYNYPRDYLADIDDLNDIDSDLVEVGAGDVDEINFALEAIDEVIFDLEVSQWSSATPHYTDYTDVDVHLFAKVAGEWQQVETFTSDEDALAYTELLVGGEFRLEFSKDGVALAVHDVYSEVYYPYTDYVEGEAAYSPAACFLDVGNLTHGNYYYGEVSLVPAPVGSECGEPAPVLPPSSFPVKKPKPGAAAAVTDVQTAPTSTPTPTPTAEPSDTPDDESAADEPGATSAPDLTWAFWVAGVLVLFVLAGGAVYFVRRRP